MLLSTSFAGGSHFCGSGAGNETSRDLLRRCLSRREAASCVVVRPDSYQGDSGEMIAEEVEREAVPVPHTMSISSNTSSVPIGQLFGVEPPSLSSVQRLDYPGVAQDGELGLSQRG